MYMNPAPTTGKVALQWGALFGVPLGAFLIAQALFLPPSIFVFGLPVLVLLLAGLFAASWTGSARRPNRYMYVPAGTATILLLSASFFANAGLAGVLLSECASSTVTKCIWSPSAVARILRRDLPSYQRDRWSVPGIECRE